MQQSKFDARNQHTQYIKCLNDKLIDLVLDLALSSYWCGKLICCNTQYRISVLALEIL